MASDDAAVRQPDFMAGAHFGCHRRKFDRQVLDQSMTHGGLELGRQLGSTDQAGAVQADVEIAEDIARLQPARPFLERIEVSGGIGAADHCADRRSDHDVRDDAVGEQRSENADMGKSARSSAAQRKADDRPPDAAKSDLSIAVRGGVAAPRSDFPAQGFSLEAQAYSQWPGLARMSNAHGLCGWSWPLMS